MQKRSDKYKNEGENRKVGNAESGHEAVFGMEKRIKKEGSNNSVTE